MMWVWVLTGLALGSFANMWSWRHDPQSNHQVNRKRSVCDYCGRQLNWWENIPVVSFLLLKGKTYCCRKSLPFRYVIVELLGGIYGWLGYVGWLSYQGRVNEVIGWGLILGVVGLSLLVVAYDLSYLMIPVFPVIGWIGVGVIWKWLVGGSGIEAIEGMGVASGFLLALYGITKGKGMGLGDVILVMSFGWFLGLKGTMAALWLGFVLGSIGGLILVFGGWVKKGIKGIIALGPFLVTAFWITWAFQWWQRLIQ